MALVATCGLAVLVAIGAFVVLHKRSAAPEKMAKNTVPASPAKDSQKDAAPKQQERPRVHSLPERPVSAPPKAPPEKQKSVAEDKTEPKTPDPQIGNEALRAAAASRRTLQAARFALGIPQDRGQAAQQLELAINVDQAISEQAIIDLLDGYLASHPQDAEAYLLLGEAYRKKGDVSNARKNFEAGFNRLTLTPPIPPRLSWAYSAYGYLLYNDRDYERAYVILTDALKLNPNDATILYNYGLTCLALNRNEELESTRAKLRALNSPMLVDLDRAVNNRPGTKR